MLIRRCFFFIAVFLFFSCGLFRTREIPVIPRPQNVNVLYGSFSLDKTTRIQVGPDIPSIRKLGIFLNEMISPATGFVLPVVEYDPSSTANSIILLRNEDPGNMPAEAYTLIAARDHVKIEAASDAGLFYGLQTLRQLLPSSIESKEIQPGPWTLPCVKINDEPRFPWRGMNFDVCRHFMDKEFVKRYIDLLAYYKMNVFHWHLTEDQGWRIEILQYPKLTETGAWRKDPDGKLYGGFYTQDDVREIVSYAAERHITVVPEIELPGHCQAALAAYPGLSCTGGPFEVSNQWGIRKDVYCAGKEETFEFLEDVLTEIMILFPSRYIHIGGDEVPKDRWRECPDCQKRMGDHNMQNEDELQSYFIKRIEKFLNRNGRQLIGWDEILEGGLAPGATVQSWRGIDGGIAAARAGHDVIMSPYEHTYFNRSAFTTPLHKVYDFEPVPDALNENEALHILGGECCMWTEYAPQEKIDTYMFPRLPAIAEVFWTNSSQKDFERFYNSLQNHYIRYDHMGIRPGPEAEPVTVDAFFDPKVKQFCISLIAGSSDIDIFYTHDNCQPTLNSHRYRKPLRFRHGVTLVAQAFLNGEPYGDPLTWESIDHLALGVPATLEHLYHHKYSGGGKLGLTNGIKGSDNFLDGAWQGFEGEDLIAVIDLGKRRSLSMIQTGFLQKTGSWIFMPEEVRYYISDDGSEFSRVATLKPNASIKENDIILERLTCKLQNTSARFVKVHAKNIGMCPGWHPGAGGKAWIFSDEIIIR